MKCKCGDSKRVASINAKCSDLCFFTGDGVERDGYVPYHMGVGGGDYVEFDFCMDCGQIDGDFPLRKFRKRCDEE